jgi:hypothetical protein
LFSTIDRQNNSKLTSWRDAKCNATDYLFIDPFMVRPKFQTSPIHSATNNHRHCRRAPFDKEGYIDTFHSFLFGERPVDIEKHVENNKRLIDVNPLGSVR